MTRDGSDAELARRLFAGNKLGYFSTLSSDPAGFPFGSLLPYALDSDGNPVFLVSTLAEHTKNFLRDPRASLLVTDEMRAAVDPLALQRATLIGHVEPAVEEEDRDQYLAAHPSARNYIEMKDFAFYRLVVEAVRYVGGFGRMSWIDSSEFAAAN